MAKNSLKSNVLTDHHDIHNKKIQNERRAVVVRTEDAVARPKLEVNVILLLPISLSGNTTSHSFPILACPRISCWTRVRIPPGPPTRLEDNKCSGIVTVELPDKYCIRREVQLAFFNKGLTGFDSSG